MNDNFMHIDYKDGSKSETTPFSVHEQAFKVRQVIEKKLLREQIEAIILDGCFVGKNGINCEKAVRLLVEMMEGK